MNRLFSTILFLLLIACNDSGDIKVDSKVVKIKLIDSLGFVELSIPLRYDTSYSWTAYSDCGKACDDIKYRFQPKELRIVKEPGEGVLWFNELTDSIDRFTIKHKGDFPFYNGDSTRIFIVHRHIKEQLADDPRNAEITFDTIQKINDRYSYENNLSIPFIPYFLLFKNCGTDQCKN